VALHKAGEHTTTELAEPFSGPLHGVPVPLSGTGTNKRIIPNTLTNPSRSQRPSARATPQSRIGPAKCRCLEDSHRG
jgi:hypothetical protein